MVASWNGFLMLGFCGCFFRFWAKTCSCFHSPHHLAGWLESPGTHIQDPRPVTIPLPSGRRGGERGC